MIYGSIPAGGLGIRMQPLGFSKELAPIGGKAVIEHLLDRMVLAGIERIFINTAEDKTDLIRYLATKSTYKNNLIFMVRDRKGLQDGVLMPGHFLEGDDWLIWGLPDTLWYPKDAYTTLLENKAGKLALGLFHTNEPDKFDSVVADEAGKVLSIEVKVESPKSDWIWGIGAVQVSEISTLSTYESQQKTDKPLFGVSMHAYAQDHLAFGVKIEGSSFLDIGVKEAYETAESFVRAHEQ